MGELERKREVDAWLFDDLICGSDLVDGALRLGLRWTKEKVDRQIGIIWMVGSGTW
jgi:hypothetical protein